MSRTPIRLLVLLAASFTAIALAVPAQAAAPYCGITWGSAGQAELRRHRWRRSRTSVPAATTATTGWSSTCAASARALRTSRTSAA